MNTSSDAVVDPSRGVEAEIASRWPLGKRRFRTAIIGCGRIAHQHARVLKRHPATTLVGLCDTKHDVLQAFGEQYDVPADGLFTGYEELLDTIHPDVVHICTWPDTHAQITAAAATRGIHVYCEKPIALDLPQADMMLRACRDAGVVLGINHHRRGDSRFLRAKRLIQDGAIGQLRLLKGDHGGGGRELMAKSTHLYDLFRYVAGDVQWVFGNVLAGGREATAQDSVDLHHEGLAAGDEVSAQFGFVNGTYAYHNGLGHVDVEIVGTHGRMVFHEGTVRKPWPLGETRAAWAHYPNGNFGRAGKEPAPWQPLPEITQEELSRPQHAFSRMIDRFLRAIDGEGAPLCTGHDGRASLEMALGLYASHFSRCRVDFPLGPEHPLSAR